MSEQVTKCFYVDVIRDTPYKEKLTYEFDNYEEAKDYAIKINRQLGVNHCEILDDNAFLIEKQY